MESSNPDGSKLHKTEETATCRRRNECQFADVGVEDAIHFLDWPSRTHTRWNPEETPWWSKQKNKHSIQWPGIATSQMISELFQSSKSTRDTLEGLDLKWFVDKFNEAKQITSDSITELNRRVEPQGGRFRGKSARTRVLSTCTYFYYPRLDENALRDGLALLVSHLNEELSVVMKADGERRLLEMFKLCTEFMARFLLLHPFIDGNGRTVEGVVATLLKQKLGFLPRVRHPDRNSAQRAIMLHCLEATHRDCFHILPPKLLCSYLINCAWDALHQQRALVLVSMVYNAVKLDASGDHQLAERLFDRALKEDFPGKHDAVQAWSHAHDNQPNMPSSSSLFTSAKWKCGFAPPHQGAPPPQFGQGGYGQKTSEQGGRGASINEEVHKIVSQANSSFYVKERGGGLVLGPADESNPHQQWIKDTRHTTKKDKEGTAVGLYKWNKQENENQKWKILPITSTGAYGAQAHNYGQQAIKLSCEAKPDFFINARGDGVVLAAGEDNDPRQEWTKEDRMAQNKKDAGAPAFVLINKATNKALEHGSKEFDKVELVPLHGSCADDSVLWTLSADVGKGYKCLRPVRDIHLNLDASHGDEEFTMVQSSSCASG